MDALHILSRSTNQMVTLFAITFYFKRFSAERSRFHLFYQRRVQINSTIDQQSIPPFVFLPIKMICRISMSHFLHFFLLISSNQTTSQFTNAYKWKIEPRCENNCIYRCLMCSTLVFFFSMIFSFHLTSNRIIYANILVIIIQKLIIDCYRLQS